MNLIQAIDRALGFSGGETDTESTSATDQGPSAELAAKPRKASPVPSEPPSSPTDAPPKRVYLSNEDGTFNVTESRYKPDSNWGQVQKVLDVYQATTKGPAVVTPEQAATFDKVTCELYRLEAERRKWSAAAARERWGQQHKALAQHVAKGGSVEDLRIRTQSSWVEAYRASDNALLELQTQISRGWVSEVPSILARYDVAADAVSEMIEREEAEFAARWQPLYLPSWSATLARQTKVFLRNAVNAVFDEKDGLKILIRSWHAPTMLGPLYVPSDEARQLIAAAKGGRK